MIQRADIEHWTRLKCPTLLRLPLYYVFFIGFVSCASPLRSSDSLDSHLRF